MTGSFKYIKPEPPEPLYEYTISMTAAERTNIISLLRSGRDESMIPNGIRDASRLLDILGVKP